MTKKIIIHDVGAANFLPEHFCLDERFSYVHFEPDDRGLQGLRSWIQKNKSKAQHTYCNQAVGDESKTVTLALADKNTSSKIVRSGFSGRTKEVTMSPLKSVVIEDQLKLPDILKVDVEGYELNVLKGADLFHEKLKVVEVEVTLAAGTLSEVVSILTQSNFELTKLRCHGTQEHNPRNWMRGKIHGISRKLKMGNFGAISSEESWSKPTTRLTQVEFVFTRGVELHSDDPTHIAICDIYGLAHRENASARLKCGDRKVDIINELTLIR